jgi:iron(III) transport system permease protein
MKNFVLNIYNNGFKKILKMDFLRLILCIFLLFGVILPIIFILFQINREDFTKVFSDTSFYKLLYNSFISTIIASIISLLLALICAYLLDRSSLKRKNMFIVLLSVPMLIPSISHAMGLINLFGKNGFLDKLFGLGIEVYGILGIVMGSVMYSFPVAFLLIYDALKYEDKSIYDVTETLGISKISAFFKITLPYLKKVLISAFFATFTMIFTDYGVPLAIGGKFSTLPVFLYQEVISRMNFSKGAIIAIFLWLLHL